MGRSRKHPVSLRPVTCMDEKPYQLLGDARGCSHSTVKGPFE